MALPDVAESQTDGGGLSDRVVLWLVVATLICLVIIFVAIAVYVRKQLQQAASARKRSLRQQISAAASAGSALSVGSANSVASACSPISIYQSTNDVGPNAYESIA